MKNWKLVLVLEKWLDFRQHVDKWGYLADIVYRIEQLTEGLIRIRVTAGKFGFDERLERDDPMLEEITDFLKQHSAKRIDDARDILSFFS